MTKSLLFALCIALILLGSFYVRAQGPQIPKPTRVLIGPGVGMDYGGLGFKIEYLPVKYLGVLGALGYNFKDLGLNAGLQFRPLPDKFIQPLVLFMYGYNGVINIDGSEQQMTAMGLEGVNGTYYGFTTGIGGELRVGKARKNRLYLGLLYPFRTKTFRDNYQKVTEHPQVSLSNKLLPVTFSFGFNRSI